VEDTHNPAPKDIYIFSVNLLGQKQTGQRTVLTKRRVLCGI